MILNKKKFIRNLRKVARNNSDGTHSSHLMAWAGDPSKRFGEFYVFPTIRPKPGNELSTNPDDWTTQNMQEAALNKELLLIHSRRKARRLAAGSWKPGPARREAMKAYRAHKNDY